MKKQKALIELAPRDLYNGSGACAAVCHKVSISMKENREGFIQPKIDIKKCTSVHENVLDLYRFV